ncbi:uncharacterized protein B0I36DRAFT_406468 [Microdochium trichocladiopsis]|uniref:BTB domain-containing protein n=1 Tax=Microdochium trichocladiopsis TaxID=1682393 RepID=A0A9P8YDA6_9PEZI|nr:uncharacterized protein B0I36DRAFT_406468 [Microdochium trichocladiopsis]KAH7035810.1 hypothetical protein B0I36DRAFT_406468 [Microdochium trichocladiopsis]
MATKKARTSESKRAFERRAEVPKVFDSDQIVVIKTPEAKVFRVHAHLLVQYSDYFLHALNSGMKESKSMEFQLEKHANDLTVGALVDWLYAKPAGNVKKILEDVFPEAPVYDDLHINTAYRLWQLADYLKMPVLQNDVMRLLHKVSLQHQGSVNQVRWDILEDLDERSMLFRLYTTILASYAARLDYKKIIANGVLSLPVHVLEATICYLAGYHAHADKVYKLDELLVDEDLSNED